LVVADGDKQIAALGGGSAYMNSVTVTESYAALVSASTEGVFEISCPPTNVGNVTFKFGGNTMAWVPGEWHTWTVDLADVQIIGTAGDVVTIVGRSW